MNPSLFARKDHSGKRRNSSDCGRGASRWLDTNRHEKTKKSESSGVALLRAGERERDERLSEMPSECELSSGLEQVQTSRARKKRRRLVLLVRSASAACSVKFGFGLVQEIVRALLDWLTD
jgi:hypothetical protein